MYSLKKIEFKLLTQTISSVLYASLLYAVKNIKLSFIIGSHWAFFGAAQMLSPLAGFFSTSSTIALLFAIRALFSFSLSGLALSTALLYHIPTLCGTLYLSQKSSFLRALIPALCIILFITNPVGSQAALYSSYWLIPLVLSFVSTQSIFLRSLGSTLTTHAVGSILFLYTKNIDALTWNALISVVWAERLLFALAMTAIYYVVSYAYKSLTNTGFISCEKVKALKAA